MGNTDIIAAIATPLGKGGVGVVRVSGKGLHKIIQGILGFFPKSRHASLSNFKDNNGLIIDQGIVIFYPAPSSYTGEDVLELQGHGGPAVMDMLLSRCLSLGARIAEPGEFTLRAFLNNKLDLAQAESVADIINASTKEAARCAMRSLQGDFSTTISVLAQKIIDLRMLIEATLDFPEEETCFLKHADIYGQIKNIKLNLENIIAAAQQGSLLREGVNVVLVGQPNVGKSSLMNKLAKEEVAIVTAIPGTTRDTIRETIQIEGVPIHLIDTAGLRETGDEIEQIGIARAWAAIEKGGLVLLLTDCRLGITKEDQQILEKLPGEIPLIHINNKIDLLKTPPQACDNKEKREIYLSAKTGAGVDQLRQELLETVGWSSNRSASEGIFMARHRHLKALAQTKEHLQEAYNITKKEIKAELLAEEMRLAHQRLLSITGEFSADDLLGEIFSRFCIGK
ncbi:MAG: tRNA uridine-5-carboxymethylaminomethyl(34) synthesis GTPase MnmE [Nitrosomonadaceae bacterium]|nr:tRNA uridine-5-carboxymethylaminomethyl(34) synthesis GTPase MnmE [Nitrosomonadaceae bacterium]|tara:strand:- start:2929 stop:4287 length:1359 start_codon:yes stop_codon:yes gene_type:complete